MITKMKLKKGDTVVINSGVEKGKKGKVLETSLSDNKVIVEGINIRTRHVKAKKQGQESGIIKREAPINASKANVFCAKCEKGVKVGYKFLENGDKVRVCRKCSEEIK